MFLRKCTVLAPPPVKLTVPIATQNWPIDILRATTGGLISRKIPKRLTVPIVMGTIRPNQNMMRLPRLIGLKYLSCAGNVIRRKAKRPRSKVSKTLTCIMIIPGAFMDVVWLRKAYCPALSVRTAILPTTIWKNRTKPLRSIPKIFRQHARPVIKGFMMNIPRAFMPLAEAMERQNFLPARIVIALMVLRKQSGTNLCIR